ncbi:MAG: FtsX-like permease family protein [Methylotenera sp.]|nr:FtsX-like permease family protein [Oligoflexia bacterium]
MNTRFWKILWACFIKPTWKRPFLLIASIAGIAAGTGILCALNMSNERAIHSFEASAQALTPQGDSGTSTSPGTPQTVQWRSPRGKIAWEMLDTCLQFISQGVQCRGVISAPLHLKSAAGRSPEGSAFDGDVQVIGMDGGWETLGAPAFSSALAEKTHELRLTAGAKIEAASSFPSRDYSLILSGRDAALLITQARGLQGVSGYDWLEVSPSETQESVSLEAANAVFEKTLARMQLAFGKRSAIPLVRTTPQKVIESQKALTFTYRFNLKVLSMMSVLIGALLVANVATLYFLLKRPTVAVLRQLGASRKEILAWVLFEQALMGLIGGVLGLGLGVQLEKLISGQVLRTISDLYLKTAATAPHLSFQTGALTVVSGMFIFLGAGLSAALSTTRVAPAAPGKRTVQPDKLRLWPAFLAALCLLVIFSSPYLPPFKIPFLFESSQAQPVAGYLGAAAVFIFSFALSQYLLAGVSAAITRLTPPRVAARFTTLAIAARRNLRSGARGRAPVATLAGGLSLAIGVTLMVGGFRESLGDWLGTAFNANIMGEVQSLQGTETRPRITEDQLGRLRATPFIEGVDCLLLDDLEFRGRPFKVAALDDALLPKYPVPMVPFHLPDGMTPKLALESLTKGAENVWPAIISETFSNKFKLNPGDRFEITLHESGGAAAAPLQLRILGSAREYSSELGYVIIARDTFKRHTGLDGCNSLRIYTQIQSSEEFIRRLGALHPDLTRDVKYITSHDLRTNALRTFNDTFAITDALAMLAALLGGLSLLTQLVQSTAERAPEWLTLRRMGNTWRDLFRFCSMDILLSVLSGVFLGLISGVLLGWVLCYSINYQAFGWTVKYGTPDSILKSLKIAAVFGTTLWAFGSLASVFVLRPGEKWRLKRE